MAGRVEAIWVKRSHGGVMDPAAEVDLVVGKGIVRDASFGRSRRQVTVIEKETFDRVRTSLPAADPVMRRANIMVSGVSLADSRRRVLRIGGVRILIHGETRPCERMDEQCEGLRAALSPSWGGGAHGVVLDDGLVRVGDAAELEPTEGRA
ncbi:MAG: MOSC domain-containing protein [Gemmatimonadales bacterium]